MLHWWRPEAQLDWVLLKEAEHADWRRLSVARNAEAAVEDINNIVWQGRPSATVRTIGLDGQGKTPTF